MMLPPQLQPFYTQEFAIFRLQTLRSVSASGSFLNLILAANCKLLLKACDT